MPSSPAPPPLDAVRRSRVVMGVRFHDPLPDGLADAVGAVPADSGRGDRRATPSLTVHRGWLERSWPRPAQGPYPDYEAMWLELAEDVARVDAWHQGAQLGRPAIAEFALTYANPITAAEEWLRRREFERLLLKALGSHLTGDHLPSASEVVTEASFTMAERSPGPRGHLRVILRCVAVEGPDPVLGVTLSARGPLPGNDRHALKGSFDAALEWVVRGLSAFMAPVPDRR